MSESFYHGLYVGCGIFAIATLALAVLLFFVLKIYKVFMYLTGISAKRAIRKMEEEADFTTRFNRKKRSKDKRGTMMTDSGRLNRSPQNEEKAFHPVGVSGRGKTGRLPESESQTDDMRPVQEAAAAEETQLLHGQGMENETQLLGSRAAEETQLLGSRAEDETQLLGSRAEDETQLLGSRAEDETQLLGSRTEDETQLLGSRAEDETQLLSIQPEDETQLLKPAGKDKARTNVRKKDCVQAADSAGIHFVIKRTILYVHTEEVI